VSDWPEKGTKADSDDDGEKTEKISCFNNPRFSPFVPCHQLEPPTHV